MAKSNAARAYIWLQCTDCGDLNYRVQKRMKGNPYKIEIKKYCPRTRKHTAHKESKKK